MRCGRSAQWKLGNSSRIWGWPSSRSRRSGPPGTLGASDLRQDGQLHRIAEDAEEKWAPGDHFWQRWVIFLLLNYNYFYWISNCHDWLSDGTWSYPDLGDNWEFFDHLSQSYSASCNYLASSTTRPTWGFCRQALLIQQLTWRIIIFNRQIIPKWDIFHSCRGCALTRSRPDILPKEYLKALGVHHTLALDSSKYMTNNAQTHTHIHIHGQCTCI